MADNNLVLRVGSLADSVVSVCLVLLLLAGGPMLDRAWSMGRHGSPEQWAYHTLMMSLGMVDHHAAHAAEPDLAVQGELSPTAGPSVAPPAPSALSAAAGIALLGMLAAGPIVGAMRSRRLALLDVGAPAGRSIAPADRPPRTRIR